MKTILLRLRQWFCPTDLEKHQRGWLWASKSDLSDEEVDAILGNSSDPFNLGAQDFFVGHPYPETPAKPESFIGDSPKKR
jgi:hypothetical protein